MALTSATVMGATLAFASSAVAHNISLSAASRKAASYAQQVVNNPSQRPDYVRARTHCRYKFKGHSHYALCTNTYETASDVNACSERMEGNISREQSSTSLFGMRHIGRPCGRPG